jgi:16S rRNA (uracil1498-N3)-methyltransferase
MGGDAAVVAERAQAERAVIRAPIAGLSAGERRLGGSVAHYLARVLRLRAGSPFVAFDPTAGTEADAVVVHVEGDAIAVRFGPTREGASAPRALTWIQGFAKADKCDAIVRDATELGATRIVVATTRRSIVRLDDARANARVARWTRIAEEAARQCGRSDAPLVERPVDWAEALALAGAEAARFCLWERATDPLAPDLFDALARAAPLAFACGPEGGIEDDEVALATAQGWKATSLGPLLLRTETVAAAVLGAVRVWSGL